MYAREKTYANYTVSENSSAPYYGPARHKTTIAREGNCQHIYNILIRKRSRTLRVWDLNSKCVENRVNELQQKFEPTGQHVIGLGVPEPAPEANRESDE